MALNIKDRAKINSRIRELESQNKELLEKRPMALNVDFIGRNIDKNDEEIRKLKELMN